MRYEPKNGCKCDESRLHTFSHSGILSVRNDKRLKLMRLKAAIQKVENLKVAHYNEFKCKMTLIKGPHKTTRQRCKYTDGFGI